MKLHHYPIEQYYCNFGVNPDYISLLQSGSLKITASDSEGEIRVIELPGHPFFLGTLDLMGTLQASVGDLNHIKRIWRGKTSLGLLGD